MGSTTWYCNRCLTTFPDDVAKCTNLGCGTKRPREGWGVLLGPGDVLDRRYLVERCLAVGGAGLTYLAQETSDEGHTFGPKLAIKVLYTTRASGPFLRRLANEAQILQELSHDHIVECMGFVQRSGSEPYLVTLFEYGGNLSQHLERVGALPPPVAVHVLRQILLALDVAHQRGVVHRDLKPDNVLLHEVVPAAEAPHVRVADFGIAKVSGALTERITKLGSFVGTPEYAAPEQFEGEPASAATDVFAAGGLLHFLLTGKPPISFTARDNIHTSYEELLAALPPVLQPADLTEADVATTVLLQEAIAHMMVPEPEERWTIHQVLGHLRSLLDSSTQLNTVEITSRGAPQRQLTPATTFAVDIDGPEGPPKNHAEDWSPPPAPRIEPVEEPEEEEGPPEMPRDAEPESPAPPEPAPLDPVAPEPEAEPESEPEKEPEPAPPPPPPPTSVPPPPVQPAPEAPPVGSSNAPAAGCMGLGVLGMGATTLLGGGAVIALWLVAAWGFGWFSTIPVARAVLADELPEVFTESPALLGKGNKATQTRLDLIDQLDERGPALGKQCGASGPLTGHLVLDDDGAVRFARIDEGWLEADEAACVIAGLKKAKFKVRLPKRVVVRMAFSLGG